MSSDPSVAFITEALFGLRVQVTVETLSQLLADLDATHQEGMRRRLRGIRPLLATLNACEWPSDPASATLLWNGDSYELRASRQPPGGDPIVIRIRGRWLEGNPIVVDDQPYSLQSSLRSDGTNHSPGRRRRGA